MGVASKIKQKLFLNITLWAGGFFFFCIVMVFKPFSGSNGVVVRSRIKTLLIIIGSSNSLASLVKFYFKFEGLT